MICSAAKFELYCERDVLSAARTAVEWCGTVLLPTFNDFHYTSTDIHTHAHAAVCASEYSPYFASNIKCLLIFM